MEMRNVDKNEELSSGETPEDVAVLYSWANLHGAKYRDFSASRREYRAQLRHRAAEQAREQELWAQADAEAAADAAESTVRQAKEAAMSHDTPEMEYERQQAMRAAEQAGRLAAAERIEAVRRAEAAALAEEAALREQRQIADSHASARRQAAQYAESESRRRQAFREAEVPGQISDPYTPQPQPPQPQVASKPAPEPAIELHPQRYRVHGSVQEQPSRPSRAPAATTHLSSPPRQEPLPPYLPPAPAPPRRPQGYRPDDASGVRQIYRGPEAKGAERRNAGSPSPASRTLQPSLSIHAESEPTSRFNSGRPSAFTPEPSPSAWAPSNGYTGRTSGELDRLTGVSQTPSSTQAPLRTARPSAEPLQPRAISPFSPEAADEVVQDPAPKRRRPELASNGHIAPPAAPPIAPRTRDDLASTYRTSLSPAPHRDELLGEAPTPSLDPQTAQVESAGPAWLYATPDQSQARPSVPSPTPQSSVADTLQYSRERVASRWFALKGVFEQPGQDGAEAAPVRQKETRTPVVAAFSLAGGVGKTSLVATLGRSLSSLGEKVLLTDTTSHGLLPFYFGASELRQGTVRTFSPPSGSTDAPIYLVSYGVDDKQDEPSQDALVEEITTSSRGTHRVLLDLNVHSGWLVRRMARLNPTILVPVAPDMNSVISLQSVDKFFAGITDTEGRPLKLVYLLNQFDASLPLHLDVREVLRRQLGDRLLPFVIRRAPAVSEALAEGMTIIDYSPEAPVAEDYLNVATWLRTVAAPATTGFRNVRWSER